MAKHKLYAEMYQQYLKGFSLVEVGKMYGVTRQSVFEGFRCRGYKLRTKKQLPFLSFNGDKFTLRNNGYYGKTYGNRELMHRVVWKHYKGELPDGWDVHHINHNKTDNRIENLEIYEKSEHARRFSTGNNQHKKGAK